MVHLNPSHSPFNKGDDSTFLPCIVCFSNFRPPFKQEERRGFCYCTFMPSHAREERIIEKVFNLESLLIIYAPAIDINILFSASPLEWGYEQIKRREVAYDHSEREYLTR